MEQATDTFLHMTQKSPYKLEAALAAEALLRRHPLANKSKIARDLDIARVTVVRISKDLKKGIRVPAFRCPCCGSRLLRPKCLACELKKVKS